MVRKIKVDFFSADNGFDVNDLSGIIMILEEKHGLRIKTCENCNYCKKVTVNDRFIELTGYYCFLNSFSGIKSVLRSENCGAWLIKEKPGFEAIRLLIEEREAWDRRMTRRSSSRSGSGPCGG